MARERSIMPEGRNTGARCVIAESPSDLRAWIESKQAAGRFIQSGWGSISPAMWRAFEMGDNAMAAKADALLDRIEAANPSAIDRRETVATVTGGAVNVAAYLAGSPMSMRRRQRVEAPAPLKIVLDVTVSAGFKGDVIERRGAAALALLRLLVSAGHAVELWVAHGCGEGRGLTGLSYMRLDTAPLDLARTAWIMGSEGYSRFVGYGASCTVRGGPTPYWPWNNVRWCDHVEEQTRTHALALQCDPSGLIMLPGLYLHTQRDALHSDADAVRWVNERYAETLARSGLGEG